MEKQKYFKNIVNCIILASILSIVFGVVLIMLPEESLVVFGTILAFFYVALGIALIYLDIKAAMYYLPMHTFLIGVLCIVIGAAMFMHPESIYSTLAYAVGAWAIVSSAEDIRMAIVMKRAGIPFGPILLINILNILAGVFIILNPTSSSLSIVLLCGVGLIVNGVVRIADMIMIKRDIRVVEDYIREVATAVENERKAIEQTKTAPVENETETENKEAE